MQNNISFLFKKNSMTMNRKSMTIKKLFAFLFHFDKIDHFDNELQGAYNSGHFFQTSINLFFFACIKK